MSLQPEIAITPLRRRRLVLEALVLVTVTELVLRVMRMRRIEALALRAARSARAGSNAGNVSAADVAGAVQRASRRSPSRPMCLAQALTATYLLSKRGIDAELKIGVAKGASGAFEAHAWIERQGSILLGAQRDMLRYRVIYTKAWGSTAA